MNVATAEIEEKVSEVPVEEKPQENPSDDVEDEDSLVIDETKAATNQSQDAPKEEAKDAPSPKAEKETSNDGTNSGFETLMNLEKVDRSFKLQIFLQTRMTMKRKNLNPPLT